MDLDFRNTKAVYYGNQKIKEVYYKNIKLWEARNVLINENTLGKPTDINSGWFFDGKGAQGTKIEYTGSSIQYIPQPGAWVPYISVKIPSGIKQGEKWFIRFYIGYSHPSTHRFQFELGSENTWSTNSKTLMVQLPANQDPYNFYWFDRYTYSQQADYIFLSMRGANAGVGTGNFIKMYDSVGLIAINLTKSNAEHLTANQLLSLTTSYKTEYAY